MIATTAADGSYRIDKIPTGGSYTVMTSSLGLETIEFRMEFTESKAYVRDLFTSPKSFEMEEVVVLARGEDGSGGVLLTCSRGYYIEINLFKVSGSQYCSERMRHVVKHVACLHRK